MKVKATKSNRTSGASATKKAKAPQAKAVSGAKVTAPKGDKFGGSTKAPADKPAAQLPRSGWSSTESFKKAARASRDLAGLQAGGLHDRPIIRPMYGLPVPLPLDPNLKDKHLEAAVKTMLGDRKITLAEVKKLIGIAKENGIVSKTEKRDLKRLIDNAGSHFDMDALRTLSAFIKDAKPAPDPVIRPMYGMPFTIPLPDGMKNKDLKDALPAILGDRKVTLDEVNKLISIAGDNGGISQSERADLEKVFDQAKPFFDADAHFRLGQAIGREPVIRPLYGMVMPIPLPDLKDKSLKQAAKDILQDRTIDLSEVKNLISAAKDNHGLSKTERTDLNRLLTEIGDRFQPDAKAALTDFLKGGNDGLPISAARRDHILNAFEKQASHQWSTGFPLGVRMVEVPLKSENHPDGFSYTALIPVGALAPNAPMANPESVNNAWIRQTGGIAGMTRYTHIDF